jgi:hypothetical protein
VPGRAPDMKQRATYLPFGHSPRSHNTIMYPWEIHGNIENTSKTIDISSQLSTVRILNSDHHEYRLGDTIYVCVDILDANGRIRYRGGDDIRILIRGRQPGTNAAGHVSDHVNGSYTTTFRALWVGVTQVIAVIAGMREGSTLFHTYHEQPGALVSYKGQYTLRSNKTFPTVCHPYPTPMNPTDVCNLTKQNYGVPWFCKVRSRDQTLCQKWTFRFVKNDLKSFR